MVDHWTPIANLLGPNVELRRDAEYLQWRVQGSGGAWVNLLPLADIQGLPGVNAVANDTATAGYVANPSLTQVALDARYTGSDSQLISVRSHGVTGDGVTDDTAAINALITANPGRTLFFPGNRTYLVTASGAGGLAIKMDQAGTRLLLDTKAVIKVIPNALTNYHVISVTAADCVIEGAGTILGDSATHLGTTGEWGHCIAVSSGADRCRVQGVTVKNAWGDGIVVQLGPSDVSLINVTADDNRRQGLSLTGCIRPRVLGGVYKNTGLTSWTLPAAGIDIEPNPSSGFNVIDALIVGVTLFNNRGEGLLAIRATGVTTEAIVSSCTAYNNGAGSTASGFRAGGSAGTMLIKFNGNDSHSNTGHGYDIYAPNVEASVCTARANAGDGFNITGTTARIVSPVAEANGGAGVNFVAGSDSGGLVGGETIANSQTTNGASSNVEIASVNVRVTGHLAIAGGLTNKPAYGYNIKTGAGARLYGCDVSGTFVNGTFLDTPGNTTMFPRPGAARSAAIASPTADVASLKVFADAVRAVLISKGDTA